MKYSDFVIIGAGVVGLTVARELLKRKAGSVCLLEKEPTLGKHSSGRNSGVLHSGVYYPPESLKAKVCVRGARLMREYALERKIPLSVTGKVIVAPTPKQTSQVDELYRRAQANGVRAEIVDEKRLRDIEPEATTSGRALYSPDTAVIDAKAVLRSLHAENAAAGARLVTSSEVRAIDPAARIVRTKGLELGYGFLVNAAGLHADRIAHIVGAGLRYRILPFKGIYHKLRPEAATRYRGSIYPVPDLSVPFLGVHITRTVSGEVTLGPTAIPAFGRENYAGFAGFDLREAPAMARDLALMMISNRDGFGRMVFQEVGRYRSSAFTAAARALSPSLSAEDIVPSDKVGIRAQLFDRKEKKLVMDLVIEEGDRSLHVLNAISPAFTGSLAFAEIVADRILGESKK